ncbi:thioredoxin fold domain-containing protein [Acetobacter sp. LMG 1636]|uniref:Thioredoxin fold domain-containing protein n=2 Tax=Acetobacter fallax TaxID=1737473 RepID=A0ABX0K8Q9_9PROT|nr:thioredoxin fold domain-containing protein [Acetobacter fallax]NHO35155.1 thioredoxin fold domain-containing protein [Acetobacter fallax]
MRYRVAVMFALSLSLPGVLMMSAPNAACARAITEVPQIGEASVTPVAAPYDAPEKAPAAVAAAFEKAKAEKKSVLLDFGGNWCPDCRILAGIFALPAVDTWLKQNFEVVSVNVSRFKTNMDIAQKYGVTVTSVPTVLIVTPEGKALNTDGSKDLGNARRMSSQAVVNLIAGWAARD